MALSVNLDSLTQGAAALKPGMIFAILGATAHQINTNNWADLSICPLSKHSLRLIAGFKTSTNLPVTDLKFRLGNGLENTLFSS